MTYQNRVRPTGEIVADHWHGEWMGNRGILHDGDKRLGPARWKHQNWVTCRLLFKGRKREIMRSGSYYTELFFYDEACALAAGHRPCAECRREDYLRFRAAWERAHGPLANAAAMDRALHGARVISHTKEQVRYWAKTTDLPDGTMILVDDNRPALVWRGVARVWTTTGYLPPEPLARGDVRVCTPAPTVAALRAGYRPALHPSLAHDMT